MVGEASHLSSDDMETCVANYCARTRFESGQALTVTPSSLRDLGLSPEQMVDIGIQHIQFNALAAYGMREQTFANALDLARQTVPNPGYEVTTATLDKIGVGGGSRSSEIERS